MIYRVSILSLILITALSLVALPQGQKPATPAAPVVEEPPPVLSVPKDYKYDARGRRDPFVNPVPRPKAVVVAPPTARPAGLKGVLVNEATITGVVTSADPSMTRVIISAPGTKTPYFAHVGDQLYDAVVKSISLDAVTFALTAPGTNEKSSRELVRKVRPTPGEEK